MPVSKRRKKKGGAIAKFNRDRRDKRIDENSYADQPAGVSLQDLINMVAYQEYQAAGVIDGPAIPDDSPDDKVDNDKEIEDGR